MKQPHIQEFSHPEGSNVLTKSEKKKALKYLMSVKQKLCKKSNVQVYADGRKQIVYKMKEETSSPTVVTESMFLSCVIDAE